MSKDIFSNSNSEIATITKTFVNSNKSRQAKNMYTTEDTALSLVEMPLTLHDQKLKCENIYYMFQKNKNCSHIVILDKKKPVGLITRFQFMLSTSGAFGFSLNQRRPVMKIAKKDFLALPETTDIPDVASAAMHRDDISTYDPVIITDTSDNFIGTIEIKSLMLRSSQLEIETAKNANPLTGLPGNKSINSWLHAALKAHEYYVIYGDLSNFKEYNDIYGFAAGDNLIQLCGSIMYKHGLSTAIDSKIGHIGGDDFIIVVADKLNKAALEDICKEFDQSKGQYFKEEHLKNGVYEARNRQGQLYLVPLTTLSLSVISKKNFTFTPHIAELAKAAATLKKVAKNLANEKGCSCVVYERRIYNEETKP